MLTVANGLTSVPSPLKLMPSTMAFGTATPLTMLYPCALNTYSPRSVRTLQVCCGLDARATPAVPSIVAAARLANAHAKSEQLVIIFISFVFIIIVSLCLRFSCFGLLWLLIMRSYFWPFMEYRTETSARLRGKF